MASATGHPGLAGQPDTLKDAPAWRDSKRYAWLLGLVVPLLPFIAWGLVHATGLAVPAELVFLSKRKGQEVRIHQSDRPDDEICLLFGRSPGRMEKSGGDYIESNHASPARLSVFDAPLARVLLVDADEVFTEAGESSVEKNQWHCLNFPEPFEERCVLFHRRHENRIDLPRQHQLDKTLLIFRILL